MARPLRINFAGAWSLVMSRGSGSLSNTTFTAINAGLKTRTVTVTGPDLSWTVSTTRSNRLESVTRYSSAGSQISKTTYDYDSHGRRWHLIDARNGTTTFNYGLGDSTSSATTLWTCTILERPSRRQILFGSPPLWQWQADPRQTVHDF